jgi:hypothetical protein
MKRRRHKTTPSGGGTGRETVRWDFASGDLTIYRTELTRRDGDVWYPAK